MQMTAIFCLLACGVGVLLGWLLGSRRGRESVATFVAQLAAKDELLADFRSVKEQLEIARRAHAEDRELLAGLRSQVEAERKASDEKLKILLEVEENLKHTFKSLAVSALDANGKTFLELAEGKLKQIQSESAGELSTKKAQIDGLITPMAESLKNLDESVRSLRQSEVGLLNETRQLASALKETKKRGNWGELQLKRIAELSGMEERCDFTLQAGILTDENRRLYPDMTVNLPNSRVIVVDSKASMVAYGQSAIATDPIVQQQKLMEHARAVRQRVDELASKEYQNHVAGSADFVVCFIPGEGFFSAAVAADADLLEYAARKSVILASPTTFLTILRAVALGWKEAKIASEAKQIFTLASDLYDRFRTSTKYIDGVGNGLKAAVKEYNSFIGSVESRVFPQARKLQRMSGFVEELKEFEPVELNPRELVANDWISRVDTLTSLVASQGEPGSD